MKPGRELDALVAKKVMGETVEEELGFIYPDGRSSFGNSPEYTRQKCENYARQGFGTKLITRKVAKKPYSTDIAAAWEVVEKLNQSPDWSFGLVFDGTQWVAGMGAYSEDHEVKDYYRFIFHSVEAEAATVPHAICLAALKAVRVTV